MKRTRLLLAIPILAVVAVAGAKAAPGIVAAVDNQAAAGSRPAPDNLAAAATQPGADNGAATDNQAAVQAAPAPPPAEEPETGPEPVVLYPPDLTLSMDESIKVLAFKPGATKPIRVSVNGMPQPPLEGEAMQKGQAKLYDGLNLVRVGGKVIRLFHLSNAKLDEFTLPTREGEPPLVFKAYRLHPALDDGCEGCHTVEGEKLAAKPQKEACYACHNNFEKADGGKPIYVHQPVAAGECTGCHDPHYSVRPKLQKLEKGCLECHDAPAETGTVHYPVKNRECTSCHNPHAGPAPKQLVRAGNALCVGCHENPHKQHRSAEVKGTLTQVPENFPKDGAEMSCLGCHMHHQSTERRLFRTSQGTLCQTCHRV